jgi:2-C-methyl-D-erythritol 4-phosphate cytidylyltransferase
MTNEFSASTLPDQVLPDQATVGAIIVAAGASTRMGDVDKTLADLAGTPLIARTVGVFERCDAVGTAVLMIAQKNLGTIAEVSREHRWKKVAHVRLGGERRQDTVRIGLRSLPPCEWVIVHDGARPLVTEREIRDGLRAASATGAAIAAVVPADTVKRVTDDGRVLETLDRRTLALAQTPQVFRRDLLERAHDEVGEDATDDAAMLERIGVEVRVYRGAATNIKITTPEDLVLAEALIAAAAAGKDADGAPA